MYMQLESYKQKFYLRTLEVAKCIGYDVNHVAEILKYNTRCMSFLVKYWLTADRNVIAKENSVHIL